jgi:hypothetical protein
MLVNKLNEFIGGWFLGNFKPSLNQTEYFEVAVKKFSKGDREPAHFQKIATEITVVINGKIRLGTQYFGADEIITIEPFESVDFECIENCELVCIKFPSLPNDKVLS